MLGLLGFSPLDCLPIIYGAHCLPIIYGVYRHAHAYPLIYLYTSVGFESGFIYIWMLGSL